MSSFSDVQQNMPPGHVVVPPEAWSSSWADRPEEEVCIGLRFVPDAELEDARVEAYRRASALFPDHKTDPKAEDLFVASFHDTLIRWVIARGTCDPNDASKPWEVWADAAEDIVVEQALTDLGAALIYDKWEEMRIASDIALPIATDEDLELLPELLTRLPLLAESSRAREQRCRRLLRFVLEELETMGPPLRPEPEEAEGEPEEALPEAPEAETSTRVDVTPSTP